MKFRTVQPVFGFLFLGLSVGLAAQAAEPPAAPATDTAGAPMLPATPSGEITAPATAPEPTARRVTLGPVGRDESGREGRLHTVARGDTLWDVSDAYLGTPWVWPSLWHDNRAEVENPHRIRPGDKLWISPWEMRPVSEDEARRLLAGTGGAPPASREDADARPLRRVRFSAAEATGFVAHDDVHGSGAVVALPDNKTMAVQEDVVSVDAGAGSLRVGDQLSFFRAKAPVIDPQTRKRIGQFVDMLGWGEVVSVNADSARVRVRKAFSEIIPADRFMRRELVTNEVPVHMTPPGVEGRVVYMPNQRTALGPQDVVYIDQGVRGGLSVGSELEVYRPGQLAQSPDHRQGVQLADSVIGSILVVAVQDANAVGVVTRASTELARGDRFRSPTQP